MKLVYDFGFHDSEFGLMQDKYGLADSLQLVVPEKEEAQDTIAINIFLDRYRKGF